MHNYALVYTLAMLMWSFSNTYMHSYMGVCFVVPIQKAPGRGCREPGRVLSRGDEAD
jgi:hypothetical protein